MFPRCLVVCTLILAAITGWCLAQSSPDVFRFGRNMCWHQTKMVQNAGCFLCSAEVEGHAHRQRARCSPGTFFSMGRWAATYWSSAATSPSPAALIVGGRVFIFGGHLHQESAAIEHPPYGVSARSSFCP